MGDGVGAEDDQATVMMAGASPTGARSAGLERAADCSSTGGRHDGDLDQPVAGSAVVGVLRRRLPLAVRFDFNQAAVEARFDRSPLTVCARASPRR